MNPRDTMALPGPVASFGELIVVDECGSSQDLAMRLAQDGAPDGTAVLSLNQTGGRGRQGREWVSLAGKDLALSVVLRPSVPAHEAPLLGMLASIAVAETLEKADLSARLRWPNDVLVHGKKIAGILPEARTTGAEIEVAVIGIGLNVNSTAEDFPEELRDQVTSMLACTGTARPIEDIARLLLGEIGLLCGRIATEGCGFIPGMWEPLWAHRGSVVTRDGLTGTAERIDRDGALMLRTVDGRLVRISSGAVMPLS